MTTSHLFPWYQRTRLPDSLLVLLVVVATHLALAWLVLHHRGDVLTSAPLSSLQVSIITQKSALTDAHKSQIHPVATLPSATSLLTARQSMHDGSTTVAQTSPAAAVVTPKQNSQVQEASEPVARSQVTQPRFDAVYLDNPVPAYPVLSRRLREEGQVMLRVFVSSEGVPDKVELQQTSGYLRLDTAAQEVVRQWRFVPARQGDASVSAWVLVPISFSLRS